MSAVALRAVGTCAPGLPDWAHASRVLRDDAPFELSPLERRAPEGLPATERRRINETSRLACLAAYDALAQVPGIDAASTATVFASSDGDGVVVAQTLAALAQRDVVVSPTAFHNSVFNAPAGYWSIAMRSTAASTTVCAAGGTIAAALLEAYAQVRASRAPVLVIAADTPFPDPVRALGASERPFACALLLDEVSDAAADVRLERFDIVPRVSTPGRDPVGDAFSGNASALALPLLRAYARRRATRISLPYGDGASLDVEVAA